MVFTPEFFPAIPNTKAAIIWIVIHVIFYIAGVIMLGYSDYYTDYCHQTVRDSILTYIVDAFVFGGIGWICFALSAIFGWLFWQVADIKIKERVYVFINWLSAVVLPAASFYFGSKSDDVNAVAGIGLLSLSIICFVSAFANHSGDLGIVDCLLAVGISTVWRIHTDSAYLNRVLRWTLFSLMLLFLGGGRILVPWIVRKIVGAADPPNGDGGNGGGGGGNGGRGGGNGGRGGGNGGRGGGNSGRGPIDLHVVAHVTGEIQELEPQEREESDLPMFSELRQERQGTNDNGGRGPIDLYVVARVTDEIEELERKLEAQERDLAMFPERKSHRQERLGSDDGGGPIDLYVAARVTEEIEKLERKLEAQDCEERDLAMFHELQNKERQGSNDSGGSAKTTKSETEAQKEARRVQPKRK